MPGAQVNFMVSPEMLNYLAKYPANPNLKL
jgi:hypothetical protein